ncbi:MAG TPA: hypothetical protein VIY48_12220 [Candidatus Paceibacterota bacterium]
MYNVSFNVSDDDKLTTALSALEPILLQAQIEKIVITPLNIVSQEADQPAVPAKKRSYPKNRKPPRQANGARFGSQRDRAALVVAQFGARTFDVKDIKRYAKRLGVGNTALYNALREETEAGRLAHIGYGKWQRTGGFFNSEAVNQ